MVVAKLAKGRSLPKTGGRLHGDSARSATAASRWGHFSLDVVRRQLDETVDSRARVGAPRIEIGIILRVAEDLAAARDALAERRSKATAEE